MNKEYTGKYIKIFVEGNERHKHKPLYKAILDELDGVGISGATVIRGIEGFGDSKDIRTDLLEVMTTRLPILIDVLVLSDEKMNLVIDTVRPMMKSGKIAILDNIKIYDISEE